MKSYRLSAAGRRTTLILLIAAVAIWAFALWNFRTTLNLNYHPWYFGESLRIAVNEGLTVSQAVPALLMLVLIIATPLLIWNLLEEWAATYTPTDEGLHFTSLGISILYPWDTMLSIRRLDDDSDDPIDELLLQNDYTQQIKHPLLRFLHIQAYGKRVLPIYAGIENRDDLLADIQQRTNQLSLSHRSSSATKEEPSSFRPPSSEMTDYPK